ncbi:hypothetical protein ACFLT2_13935 [Acidobacteriota bacterium]
MNPDEVRISRYSLDLARELVLLGTGSIMAGLGVLHYRNTTPLTEEEVALLDPNDVPEFDRATITTKRMDRAGDILLISFSPSHIFLPERHKKRYGNIGINGHRSVPPPVGS